MKRVFVLLMVALMSAVMVNAKTVRGYVSDKDGNPVVGAKMVVVNSDSPSRKSVAVTDEKGFFSVQVPDDLDTSSLVEMFTKNGTKVIQYQENMNSVRIVIEPARKPEKTFAQR